MKLTASTYRTTRPNSCLALKAGTIALALAVLISPLAPTIALAQSSTTQPANDAATPSAPAPAIAPDATLAAPASQPTSSSPESPPVNPAASNPVEANPAEANAVEASAAEANAILPHELTPIGMFMAADYIVKAVMIGLAFASIVTWSVWLAKTIEILGARRKLMRDLREVETSRSLEEARTRLQTANSDVAVLTNAALEELQRSHDAMNHDGIKERIASLFSRIEAAATRRMTRGTSILATIGSTAPFVGLFGTVWGIMNAFIGISKSQTTNLAIVAPGIAEALLATAMGLVAAIPAVVIDNMFARAITGYRGLLGDGSAELMRMVSRDLNRAELMPHRRAAE